MRVSTIEGQIGNLPSSTQVSSIDNRVSSLETFTGSVAGSTSSLNTRVSSLETSFPAGCNTIMQAVTAKGQTPASNSPSDIATAISNIQTESIIFLRAQLYVGGGNWRLKVDKFNSDFETVADGMTSRTSYITDYISITGGDQTTATTKIFNGYSYIFISPNIGFFNFTPTEDVYVLKRYYSGNTKIVTSNKYYNGVVGNYNYSSVINTGNEFGESLIYILIS